MLKEYGPLKKKKTMPFGQGSELVAVELDFQVEYWKSFARNAIHF